MTATTPLNDRVHAGQIYTLIGTVPHVCRDGRRIELQVWQSACAVCGAAFEFKTPMRDRFVPNRRCAAHKRPGIRVAASFKGCAS